MNCRKVCALLSAYMDGELTGIETLRIRDHLARCTACDSEYRSILETKMMICSLPVAEPDPDFEQRLIAGLRNVSHESGRWSRLLAPFALDGQRARLRAAGLFAAASLVLLALSVRFTVTGETARSAPRMAAQQIEPGASWSLREQDLRFAHETIERPQTVSGIEPLHGQGTGYGPVVQPVSALDTAGIAPSP